jgi:hypothetical protein
MHAQGGQHMSGQKSASHSVAVTFSMRHASPSTPFTLVGQRGLGLLVGSSWLRCKSRGARRSKAPDAAPAIALWVVGGLEGVREERLEHRSGRSEHACRSSMQWLGLHRPGFVGQSE